jgi:lipooligosaccharide transport system permease protein
MNAASFEATFGSFTRMTEQKTYDAILATPIGIREIVAGDVLWAASKSTLSGTAVLLVAVAAGLVQSVWALALPPIALLIGLVFGAMGLVVASRARAYDFFTYYFTLVISVMYFFSGIFFPLASLPPWAQASRGACRSRMRSRSRALRHGHGRPRDRRRTSRCCCGAGR